jgi:hypothetical protein
MPYTRELHYALVRKLSDQIAGDLPGKQSTCFFR